jgi:apolipoprotein D and lipocalin family protein
LKPALSFASLIFILLLAGCQATPTRAPVPTVARVDLQRFMGDWYVLANIPTRIERGAHNAVESYRLAPDGRILTTFTFRQGSFEGPLKRYEPVGFVEDTQSNAVWGMRFVWPIKADYRIAHLDDDYRVTIVAREARDYVWVLSRTPRLPENEFRELERLVQEMGYDMSKFQRVPQNW